jgi:protein arginine N-methyltransferase 3
MGDRTEKLPDSNASDSSGESDWLDVEPDEEPSTVVSLLDSETFSNPSDMLAHCREKHGFDFLATVRRLQLDFYGAIKLVNFVRQRGQQSQPLPDRISLKDIEDEEYLKPVLENDALLFTLDEVLEADQEAGEDDSGLVDSSAKELLARNKALEAELEALRDQYSNYRLAVEETLDRRWGDDTAPGPANAAPKKGNSDYYFESYAYHGLPPFAPLYPITDN